MACDKDSCSSCVDDQECSAVDGCLWGEGTGCVSQAARSQAEFWFGVGLYSLGAVLINLGSNIVKFGHTLAEDFAQKSADTDEDQGSCFSRCWRTRACGCGDRDRPARFKLLGWSLFTVRLSLWA